MDGTDIFMKGLAQATAVVKQVLPEHYANQTPDGEWDVHDLINHMLYELSWVPDLLEGMTISDVGNKYEGDPVDEDNISDLSIVWQEAADRVEPAVEESDPDETVHLSYGEVLVDDYLSEVGTDLLVHSWDLGKAIGIGVNFEKPLAAQVYEQLLPQRQRLQRSGLFGKELPVAPDADIQTKLLALLGRDVAWRAN